MYVSEFGWKVIDIERLHNDSRRRKPRNFHFRIMAGPHAFLKLSSEEKGKE